MERVVSVNRERFRATTHSFTCTTCAGSNPLKRVAEALLRYSARPATALPYDPRVKPLPMLARKNNSKFDRLFASGSRRRYREF